MNIIVCIKQVPGTTQVRINPETNTLIREGVEAIINPFDENAIEAALQLRDKHGGKVTVITMGPPQATSALRDAIALGADEAVLLIRQRICRDPIRGLPLTLSHRQSKRSASLTSLYAENRR